METTLFIARVFGIFYLTAAAGILLNRQYYKKFMEDFSGNSALVFFSGTFALIAGIVIVLLHNVWATNWTVIITLLGWGALIKGVWIIVFPGTVPRFMEIYRRNENFVLFHGLCALVFGVILTFLGFFAGYLPQI